MSGFGIGKTQFCRIVSAVREPLPTHTTEHSHFQTSYCGTLRAVHITFHSFNRFAASSCFAPFVAMPFVTSSVLLFLVVPFVSALPCLVPATFRFFQVRFLVDGSRRCPMPQPRRPTAAVITESRDARIGAFGLLYCVQTRSMALVAACSSFSFACFLGGIRLDAIASRLPVLGTSHRNRGVSASGNLRPAMADPGGGLRHSDGLGWFGYES